ncbi:MAG: DNA-processing protein DprA [Polyangiaceae bacterium]
MSATSFPLFPSDSVVLLSAARLGRRSPMRLFARGDVASLERPAITIVGTRAASEQGLAHAAEIAASCARAGFVVVSGLALGVDVAAHRAALSAGGRTVAVLGTPLDRSYPAAHASLQWRIAREHLVVSPFAIGSPVTRGNFPQRDRVMAALAVAVVVIEAPDGSGTLHTVREAVRLGRPVLLAPPVLAARPAWVAALGPAGHLESRGFHAVTCSEDAVTFAERIVAPSRKGLLPDEGSH